jgi:sRNA-binding protein
VSAEALTSLLDMIKQVPNDETSMRHKERLQQKHIKATQLSFAERTLLQEHNRFLAQINIEAKPRRSTKSDVLGTAKVMSYEDLEKAKAERVAKETAKEVRKAKKEAKKAAKEAKEATTGKSTTRGRKRNSPVDAPEPQAKVACMSEASEPVGFQMGWVSEEQQRVAPVARMI